MQPLLLISPSGQAIGSITAAARIVCCLSNARQALAATSSSKSGVSLRNPYAVDAQADQEACSATPVSDLPAVAAVIEQTSAAVQTDTPQAQSSGPERKDDRSVSRSGQASVGVQAEESVESSKQVAAAPYVIQSPHFHIYPHGPPAQRPLQPTQQQPAQVAPVINISQPTFHMHLPPPPHTTAQSEAACRQPSSDIVHAMESAAAEPTALSQPAVAAAEAAAAAAAAAKEADMPDDFDSWLPVTAIPHASGSTAALPSDCRLSAGNQPSGSQTESCLTGQICSGAHALQRQQKPCCSCQVPAFS